MEIDKELDLSHCTKMTTIKSGAFSSYYTSKITLPDSITSIGSHAFYDSYLTSIDIPSKVTTIGNNAFEYAYALTSVNMPEGLLTIGDNAFKDSNELASVDIPTTVQTIGDYAFNTCTSVDLGGCGNLTRIGSYAFYNSSNVNLDGCSKLTTIGQYALYSATSLDFTDCTSLSSIGDYALHSVSVADLSNTKLTSISGMVFTMGGTSTYNLTRVVLPSTLISIGGFTDWEYCTVEIDITRCTNLTTIEDNAFRAGQELQMTLNGLGNSNNLTTIGDYAFYGHADCTIFSSDAVYFDHTKLETIGDNAFYGCGLYWVFLPSTIKSIGYKAFSTSSLMGMDLTNCTNLQYIGSGAFEECGMIEEIYIPASVTQIGVGAFLNTSVTITFEATSTWYYTTSETNWKGFTGGDMCSNPTSSMFTDAYENSYVNCYWYRVG